MELYMAGRKMTEITLVEAVELLKLCESYTKDIDFKIKKLKDRDGREWVRVYYEYDGEENIVMNISHDKDVVSIYVGNTYYRTIYRIVKYLESRGFDLEDANKQS